MKIIRDNLTGNSHHGYIGFNHGRKSDQHEDCPNDSALHDAIYLKLLEQERERRRLRMIGYRPVEIGNESQLTEN